MALFMVGAIRDMSIQEYRLTQGAVIEPADTDRARFCQNFDWSITIGGRHLDASTFEDRYRRYNEAYWDGQLPELPVRFEWMEGLFIAQVHAQEVRVAAPIWRRWFNRRSTITRIYILGITINAHLLERLCDEDAPYDVWDHEIDEELLNKALRHEMCHVAQVYLAHRPLGEADEDPWFERELADVDALHIEDPSCR